MQERHLRGLGALETVTTLLHRVNAVDPNAGLYRPAEIQFWWIRKRSTDELDQLFWFDDAGRPAAAMIAVDFGGADSLVYGSPVLTTFVLPDATPEWIADVVDRGLHHFADAGMTSFETEVDRDDPVMQQILRDRGFQRTAPAVVECWLEASGRPEVPPLSSEYRLFTRREMAHLPHSLERQPGDGVDERLRETSLYRPELDLMIVDADERLAAHAIFWFDPATSTGVVEPVRTQDEHQGKGLARHLLSEGIERLAKLGADRISIGYEPENVISGHLYRSLGFVPHLHTDLYERPAAASADGA